MDLTLPERAKEIAEFLGKPEAECIARLQRGFQYLHAQVAADFRRANPQTDEALLDWYRQTEAYIWELSAYHLDPGFNYMGMCLGIEAHFKAAGAHRVFCLGDGIGDLTLSLRQVGMGAFYHDLKDSRTANFAISRSLKHTPDLWHLYVLNEGWSPLDICRDAGTIGYDAVLSLDFLEHVTDVPGWVQTIRGILKPDGLFFAQNAFSCGSGPDGSIPMHLQRNDRYTQEWDPLLASLGFQKQSSNWYRKPA
jgi:hypothetical protein